MNLRGNGGALEKLEGRDLGENDINIVLTYEGLKN